VRSAAAEGEVSGLEVPKKEGGDFMAKKTGKNQANFMVYTILYHLFMVKTMVF
jgi:hypothetical protein